MQVCVCVRPCVCVGVFLACVCALCTLQACPPVCACRVVSLSSLTHKQEADPPQDGAAVLGLGGLAQADAGQRHQ